MRKKVVEFPISKCPWIAQLQADTPPGCCVFCERLLPPTQARRPIKCKDRECQKTYNSLYVAWKRDENLKQGLTQRGKQRKTPLHVKREET